MQQALKGRTVFIWFAAFFAFIAAADAIMITLALRTHKGLVTEHPYEKGLSYNKVIDAYEAQASLGWDGKISYGKGKLKFSLRDKSGQLVVLDKVSANLVRLGGNTADVITSLAKRDDGKWQVAIDLPLPGLWEVSVFAQQGDKKFQQTKRIYVKDNGEK